MNFIYGKNCVLGYEAEYVEFDDNDLIFEVEGKDIDIPIGTIIQVEEL